MATMYAMFRGIQTCAHIRLPPANTLHLLLFKLILGALTETEFVSFSNMSIS